jgi:hypothetical protein
VDGKDARRERSAVTVFCETTLTPDRRFGLLDVKKPLANYRLQVTLSYRTVRREPKTLLARYCRYVIIETKNKIAEP